MTALIWLAFIISIVILQASVMPLLAIKGIKPDLMLALVVSTGILFGKDHGVTVGFFGGLVQDLASGGIFGLNTLTKLFVGYLFGSAERKVFKEHLLLPLIAICFASLANGLIMCFVLSVLHYKIFLLPAIVYNIIPTMCYNLIIAVPVHLLVYTILGCKREYTF
jgi:rod shape-determining protein MreD